MTTYTNKSDLLQKMTPPAKHQKDVLLWTYKIEIDSHPKCFNPNYQSHNIFYETGLTLDDFVVRNLFGEWTFALKHEKNDIYCKVVNIIGERITHLHKTGIIQFGSWSSV